MHCWIHRLCVIFMVGVSGLLAACAGTARGIDSSVLSHDENLSLIDTSRSKADAMVVIRYPAIVAEEAALAYYRSFEQNPIGGMFETDSQNRRDAERIAQSIITKSNYFSMSLFRELQDELPPHSVLLSPHLVVLDDEKQLSSRPLLHAEEIPSVVTIDFNVYSHPDARRMMDSEPLTFGDLVTPLFVIHSNRWLRPSTHGLLLSSSPLLSAAWAQSERQADMQFRSRMDDTPAAFYRPLDFISYLQQGYRKTPDIPLKSVGQARREVIAVEQYPLEKIRMNGEILEALERDHSIDPFAEDLVKGAATRIVTALNDVDHDRATFFTRQLALSRFDPELANAFLSRSRHESIRARLQMAETLIAAEKKFLSAQSTSLYEGSYEGAYGDQIREMIAAEYRLLEERRRLARQQNISTAIAIVAMAGAVYSSTGNSNSKVLDSSTMRNVLILGSLWSANSAIAAHAESKTIGENFLLQMAPAINRQVTVQLEWLESREEITARDFSEFRMKTLALYQNSIRSLSRPVDRGCKFIHPYLDSGGRWYGNCLAGLATGSGYGLIIDDDGETIEYVGYAKSGMAQGPGSMIYRSPAEIGALYYDGSFKKGLPDGIVLVEEPGRKPRVRRFDAGVDRGKADAERVDRQRF